MMEPRRPLLPALGLSLSIGCCTCAAASTLVLPPPNFEGHSELDVLPSSAQTASYLSSSAGVRATDGSWNAGGSSVPTSDSIALVVGETQSTGFYSAAAGTLKVSGSALASAIGDLSTPGHIASASALAGYDDFLLATTSSGTGAVSIQFSLEVDGRLSASQPPLQDPYGYLGGASVNASLSVQPAYSTPGMQCTPACAVNYASSQDEAGDGVYTASSSGSPVQSFTVTVPSGTLLSLTGQIYVNDSGDGYGISAFSTASNYLDTMHSFADVLTPGATLVSSSGHDYASPAATVPEPEGWAMLVTGLCAIGFMARRRRQEFPG